MSQKTEKKTSKRIYQIDLFRFLAAISVVLYHYLFRGYAGDNMSNLNFSEISQYFKYGYLGVDMFFIISGFVIALSIKSRSLKDFCISRISRLYPSYWLCVIITAIVIALIGFPRFEVNVKQVIINLTMFQNYINIAPVDGVYWTLFVEMKFYIFIIGTYLVLNKIRTIELDYLVYSWLGLSIIYIIFKHMYFMKILNFFFILNWSSYFIAGIIFYQIFKDKLNIKYSILLCITITISIVNGISSIEEKELHYNTSYSPLFISGFIITFYILMLLVSCGKLKSINSTKLINLGLLTYPLYLLHQNIGFSFFNKFGNDDNKYIILSLTVILMLFIAYLISNIYEPKVSNYLKTKLKTFLNKE